MYGSLRSQSKDFKPYKGQVIFTSEDDIHVCRSRLLASTSPPDRWVLGL